MTQPTNVSKRAFIGNSKATPAFAPVVVLCQPPDECPDRDAVEVQDVLGEVDPNGLVLQVVPVWAYTPSTHRSKVIVGLGTVHGCAIAATPRRPWRIS